MAIVGQACIDEMLAEMSKPESALIGFISHEARSYGLQLVQLETSMPTWISGARYSYIQSRSITAELELNGWVRNSSQSYRKKL